MFLKIIKLINTINLQLIVLIYLTKTLIELNTYILLFIHNITLYYAYYINLHYKIIQYQAIQLLYKNY